MAGLGKTSTSMEILFKDAQGPIEEFTWGRFVVRGEEHSRMDAERVGKGKDIRMIGDKVTRWKEREGHRLSIDMITGIFDEDIEVLALGLGAAGAVDCPRDVQEAIREKGIELVLLSTPEACRKYNELLRQGRKAALLAHGTC